MQSQEAENKFKDIGDIFANIDGMTRNQLKYVAFLSILQAYAAVHMLYYVFVSKPVSFTCDGNFENTSASLDSYCDSCSHKRFSPDETSIVSEWNLTCERAWLSPATMSWFMLGAVIGTPFLGYSSDSHGRKFTIFLTLFFIISANVLGAISNRFVVYCISRAISGFFCGGYVLSISVLTNELVSNRDRGMATMVTSNGRAVGVVLMAIFAYLIPHWRFFSMMASLIGIPILLLVFALPESPMWFQNKGQIEDAEKSLQAILNGNSWDFKLQNVNKKARSSQSGSICDLFAMCSLTMMTLTMIYVFFVSHVAYYTLFLIAGFESQNLYVSAALSGIIEIPSNILGPILLSHSGRKTCFSGFLLMCGLVLFVIPLFEPMESVLKVLMTHFGFFCAAASIKICFIHANEIFPTYIRSAGVGIAGVSARCGGIVAPYVARLGEIYPNLHFIVVGFLALSAAIASLNLPETEGEKLPETLDDLLKMLRKNIEFKRDKIANYHLLTEE